MAKCSSIQLARLLAVSFLALLGSGVPGLSAPTPSPSGSGPAAVKGRYLFVVETSKEMERRGVGALEGIRELLFTGMRGQLRDGESVGVWTFNEQLHTGEFPLQQWSAKNARQIAVRVLEYVQSQKFEKSGNLKNALPAVHGVATNSAFITIVLLTTGNDYITGTPFDAAITQTFKNWQSGQQKKQMPIVTILRARKGQYTDFAVTPLPFPIDIPPYPADLVKVQAPSPSLATNKPAVPLIVTGDQKRQNQPITSNVPNLIVSGSGTTGQPGLELDPPRRSGQTASATTGTPSLQELRPVPAVVSNPAPGDPKPASAGNEPSAPRSTLPAAERVALTAAAVKDKPATTDSSAERTEPLAAPQTATATPATAARSGGIVRIAALSAAGLAVAVLLLWLFLRRSPPAHRTSLITRSLEREQK